MPINKATRIKIDNVIQEKENEKSEINAMLGYIDRNDDKRN